jgi:hypothetical protein
MNRYRGHRAHREEYCRRESDEVLERFHEQGESAKSTDRSQLQDLLNVLPPEQGSGAFRDRVQPDAIRAGQVRPLRFALPPAIARHLAAVGDTSTGKLMEGVLAAFAQFDNDVRSDRTRAGMRAALEFGRWTFLAPIGYLNAPRTMAKSLTTAALVAQGIRAADLEGPKAAGARGDHATGAGGRRFQDKLDCLDEAFLFERSIDTCDRHAEKLREELTLVVTQASSKNSTWRAPGVR